MKRSTGRAKKSQQEIEYESRLRKKQKKHRGNAAGSRILSAQERQTSQKPGSRDPRIGSKKLVPLQVDLSHSQNASTKPEALSLEQQLTRLENDPRLTALLDRLDNDEELATTEQQYVDKQLAKIESLMEKLGLSLEETNATEEEPKEDMFRFLKNNPQRHK